MSLNAESELHQIVTENFDKLLSDLEEFFKQHNQTIEKEQGDIYLPIIQRLQNELQAIQTEHEQMSIEAQTSTAELERKKAILNNLMKKALRLQLKGRYSAIVSRLFANFIKEGTNKRLLAQRFHDLYIVQAPKRILFRRWIRKMRQRRIAKIEAEARQVYEKESKARSAEYNAQISQLEQELENAKHELETKQKSFIEMQQKLRKAFMRGVVNLNLEAMDVFNGAQFMDMVQEVEGKTGGTHDSENEVEEGDDEFYVEEAPNIAVIRH